MKRTAAALLAVSLSFAQEAAQRGRAEEQRACVPCHSLRLVESQRLSAAAWGRELDKMARWGAVIQDRQALLDYLSQEYPDTKPAPRPERSGDGKQGSGPAQPK
jgi:mono/diheme cytochrome c family protein